jgi:hypothetical protein
MMEASSTSKLWFMNRLRAPRRRSAIWLTKKIASQSWDVSELGELSCEKSELEDYLVSLNAETARAHDLLNLVEKQIQEVRKEHEISGTHVLCENLW